jgi:hypothetical protein
LRVSQATEILTSLSVPISRSSLPNPSSVLDPHRRLRGLDLLLTKHHRKERLSLVSSVRPCFWPRAHVILTFELAPVCRGKYEGKSHCFPVYSGDDDAASVPDEELDEFCAFPPTKNTPSVVSVEVDEWERYCKGTDASIDKETPLQYWKRLASVRSTTPFPTSADTHLAKQIYPRLSSVARDILALAAGSTNVERLFSAAGTITDPHRGSLSSKMVSKQTSAKVWLRQKVPRGVVV